METTLSWIIAWFEKRGKIPGITSAEKAGSNYFNAGLIDSLGVIEMITAIETNFGIQFGDSHFQDRRFSTIGGLSEIIDELSGKGRRDVV